jgi:alkylhydroperoxidase family enzyme
MPEKGWINAGFRIELPKPKERSLFFRSVSSLSGFFGRSEVPDIMTVLSINPRLFWAWLFFASRLMPYGRLPATTREKIILRTGWNCRSRYEWGQHVEIGLSVGLSDDDIVRVAEGPASWSSPHDRALMQACDDLCQDYCISAPVWEELSKHYNKALLIEITILIGHYQMIAGFLNSVGLVLEAPIEEKLQAFHQRIK